MRKDWHRKEQENTLEEGKRRIVLSVSYDGMLFNGWQAQEDKSAVQDKVEEAILNCTGETVHLFASGRTDSGVHALSQTCSFDTSSTIPAERMKYAINANLPDGVKIMESHEADGFFHARFSSLAREYRYYLKERDNCTVFDENRVWGIKGMSDIDLLNALAKMLLGERDFAFLSLKEDEGKSTFRDIYKSEFYKSGDYTVYRIVGNAFLYHQVRSIVGTIIKVAIKEKDIQKAKASFDAIINQKKRSNAIFTAPPYGLYFYRTVYSEEEWKELSKDIENHD